MDADITVIYQYVQDDVNRPDLQNRILRRIQRAILRYHRIDFWKKDTREQIFMFDTANTAASNYYPNTGANSLFLTNFGQQANQQFVQTLDTTKLQSFRAVWYLRKYMLTDAYGAYIYDPTTGQPGTVQGGDLSEGSADSMFDGYGYNKLNKFYRSGDNIRIATDTPLSQVFIGYYKDPVFTVATATDGTIVLNGSDSWIAAGYKDLIVADAKARIFGDIGKPDEKKSAEVDMARELLILQTNNISLSMNPGRG